MSTAKKIFLVVVMVSLGAGAPAYLGYRYFKLVELNTFLGFQNEKLELTLRATKETSLRTQEELLRTAKDKSNLAENLLVEESKNKIFESQIQEISGTVSKLTKLTQTDPELLQKYSKVYFLSENYTPASLSAIEKTYLYNEGKSQLFLSGTLPFLLAMLEAVKRDGLNIKIISAYRSFYEQASIKYGYKVSYGTGANQFSADQGYSEHQLGTAVDVTTPQLGDFFSKFAETQAYKWLILNAHRFGFVLSYPPDNAYYQFEPWHWRFVGVALATKLHGEGRYFYELTQREIDSYLGSFFD